MSHPAFAWACIMTAGSAITLALLMKKVWWAPVLGVCVQVPWIVYSLVSVDGSPLLLLSVIYMVFYAVAIPKWWRERKGADECPKPA